MVRKNHHFQLHYMLTMDKAEAIGAGRNGYLNDDDGSLRLLSNSYFSVSNTFLFPTYEAMSLCGASRACFEGIGG